MIFFEKNVIVFLKKLRNCRNKKEKIKRKAKLSRLRTIKYYDSIL